MGDITDFYPGTTKNFTVTCYINGATQDITGDTVTFRIKKSARDSDDKALLTKAADVATQGASGIAVFELAPSDTDIVEGSYFCDIAWVLAGGAEYVLYSEAIKVLERVSDE